MPSDMDATEIVAGSRPPLVDRKYMLAFALVTSLFLSWALAASLNDVLIRHFQKALDINRTQAGFIQFAFYIGYFCAALPAGFLIRRVGYKRAMLVGLLLYAVGAFLFYPAAEVHTYAFFLVALFTIAFGLAFLETSANPYVSILGDPRTSSARLNLAQSFYGIGAILGPLIGGAFIFSGVELSTAQLHAMTPAAIEAYRALEASAVQIPYLVVGVIMCVLMLVIAKTPFPNIEEAAASPTDKRGAWNVLRHRNLRWAIVAQFFYVGAQVGIWSFFIDFAKEAVPNMSEKTGAYMLSLSLGMLMIGRFSGAFIQRLIAPERLLALYAVINISLCIVASAMGGAPAVAALWATSFFMSIMFPTIFALGIEGLGDETQYASSFLIMSIIGGAILPPAMGLLSDHLHSVQLTMLVPAICFSMCLLFALRVSKMKAASRRSHASGLRSTQP
jgi:FHS family L-fucose permease-like MFS transporter